MLNWRRRGKLGSRKSKVENFWIHFSCFMFTFHFHGWLSWRTDPRLSVLVTDIQQAVLSSRRQSMFPQVPRRPSTPSRDPFYWHQDSSASQPIRRPSGFYQPITDKNEYRRSSCISRLGSTPFGRPSSDSRHCAWQAQRRNTIQEAKETPWASPVKSLDETWISVTELRRLSKQAIPSSSTRFSDV